MNRLEVKAAVRERDGHCCRDCGTAKAGGSSLHVHRLSPGSAYTLEGCITLCNPCHRKRHRVFTNPRRLEMVAEPALIRRLDKQAKRRGLSMSAYVRDALNERLERDEATDPRVEKEGGATEGE